MRAHDSFSAFYHEYGEFLSQYLHRHIRNCHDAEDVSQEIYLKAYQRGEKDRHVINRRKWTATLVYRTFAALSKKQRNLRLIKEDDLDKVPVTDGIEQMIEDEEMNLLASTVNSAVMTLPSPYQEIVQKYYYDGLPVKEVARQTGLSEENVKTHLYRGRKRLMGKLLPTLRGRH